MVTYKQVIDRLVTVIAAGLALCAILYLSGALDALGIYLSIQNYRTVFLAVVLVLIFLTTPARKGTRDKLPWYDILLLVLSLAPLIYLITFTEAVTEHRMFGTASTIEVIFSLMLTIALLEGIRRLTGWGMVIVVAVISIYPFICHHLPGILHGPSFSLERWAWMMYVSDDGIFGLPFHVSITIIIAFVVFGQLLQDTGGARVFVDLSMSKIGRVRAGPAKAAAIASAMFGSVSGVTSANVATTGSITIPLMKATGMKSEFAGAVESVASNGGQVLPPVMGVVAFIMAQLLGMSYISVCFAALLPALLYYAVVLLSIDLEAAKTGMKGVPRDQLPSLKKALAKAWPYLLAIALLIYLLVIVRFTPQKSAIWTILLLFVLSLIRKGTRLSPMQTVGFLERGVTRGTCLVAVICAGAGMILGALGLTGVAVKASGQLVDLAGGSLLLLLVFAAGISFLLGMGSTGLTAYIMVAILVAPALVELGILPIQAHLFIFWWAIAAYITPPVAIGVYVACAIADSDIWKTGWIAVRLGLATFLVPFIFIYHPGLLMLGTVGGIALAVLISLIAILALTFVVQGYMLKRLSYLEMIPLAAGSVLLIFPNWIANLIGFGLVILALPRQIMSWRAARMTRSSD